MSNDERKELLLKTGEKHPSLLMNLIDKGSPQGGFHPGPSGEQPNWCSCLKCRDMPTQTERDFRLLVLDELVLHVAQMYRQDVLALPNDADYNKGKRHAAYRQFILWQHGRLGIGVRMVIPSCCVWTIRDKFPDQYGQYVGFIPSRLG
ncbi:P2X purinoceptor 7-like isoform X2 [Ostrea edulis]|uniref:P2X purinoceptor 7-like isoform X2 n=1 Tax=Ostrea edulis TaxID=37623 RepID=UPI0024AE92DC|nr:P2X purinoceptor 7-like isoform X2 [Ostrea edulis]